MDAVAMWIGYAVMASLGVMAACGVVIYAVLLCNKATWKLLEPYGGDKTFWKFREWYWSQPENQRKA